MRYRTITIRNAHGVRSVEAALVVRINDRKIWIAKNPDVTQPDYFATAMPSPFGYVASPLSATERRMVRAMGPARLSFEVRDQLGVCFSEASRTVLRDDGFADADDHDGDMFRPSHVLQSLVEREVKKAEAVLSRIDGERFAVATSARRCGRVYFAPSPPSPPSPVSRASRIDAVPHRACSSNCSCRVQQRVGPELKSKVVQ